MADAVLIPWVGPATTAPNAFLVPPVPGGSVAALLNLLTAANDTHYDVVLTFDRPPDGPVLVAGTYTLISTDGGDPIVIDSIAFDPPPFGSYYSDVVRLTLTHQGTPGKTYQVTVAGLTGPAGELLGTATQTWIATGYVPGLDYEGGVGSKKTHAAGVAQHSWYG